MATHSNVLAWRIPRTEEPAKLQSTGKLQSKELDITETYTHTHTKMYLLLSFLLY